MPRKRIVRIAVCIFCLHVFASVALAQRNGRTESVLISVPKPYDRVVSGIQALGGRVKHQFTYVDGIAAEVPSGALQALRNLVGAKAITKDEEVQHPVGADIARGKTVKGKQIGRVEREGYKTAKGISTSSLASFATTHAESYGINMAGVGLPSLHSRGLTGAEVIVAVIDSGIRPGFPALELDGSIIGGIDFVHDGLGFSNANNDGHGTFVASMISANAEFDLTSNPALLNAISSYAPETLFNGNSIALIGSAPASKVYAVRVFGTDISVGANESTIIAAIQHVIDKRKLYDQGSPNGLKIEVCNLSLGNATLKAGRDLFDRSVDALLAAGIIPVVAAGNSGPGTLTIASPGSAFSALTVGAASFATNERIQMDVDFGEGIGALWRPFSGTQTAYFSARGPNADGRPDPDVVASGFSNLGQGYFTPADLSISSGTSFSSPIVAGVAALLRGAFPRATPIEIRNAIIVTADESVLKDGSTLLDQGRGLVQARRAYELLANGLSPNYMPDWKEPNQLVKVNVSRFLEVHGERVRKSLRNLKPGERRDILYNVPENTTQLTVTLENVQPALPPAEQNQLFGDDILLFIHSAKTSAIHEIGDYEASAYTLGGTFVILNPEPGIHRISVTGDWTNAGTISTDVLIDSDRDPQPRATATGKIQDSETLVFEIDVRSGVQLAEFLLSWESDWGNYPTNDVDMFVVSPMGDVIVDGVSLNDPERANVPNPIPGTWFVVIDGFDLPTEVDKFRLSVFLDGRIVRNNRPPTANAGADQTLQCSGNVTLNGSGDDPDEGDTLTFTWTSPSITGTLTGRSVTLKLPFGRHAFQLEVKDSLGLTATDSVIITIADSTAPTFTFVPPSMTVETSTPVIPLAKAGDNCEGPVTITHNAPDVFRPGTTIVTWTAKDGSNNVRTATTSVTYDPPKDDTKPLCSLSAFVPGPPKTIHVTVEDRGSGLKSISSDVATNLTVNMPTFAQGSTRPVVVTASKVNSTQLSKLSLRVTDVAGNVTECGPMHHVLLRDNDNADPVTINVPRDEHNLRIVNGNAGLRKITIWVNDRKFDEIGLKDGEVRLLDLRSAMRPGQNAISLDAEGGRQNGTADIVIYN